MQSLNLKDKKKDNSLGMKNREGHDEHVGPCRRGEGRMDITQYNKYRIKNCFGPFKMHIQSPYICTNVDFN